MDDKLSYRDLARWGERIFYYSSLKKFLCETHIPNGVISINFYGYILDLNIRLVDELSCPIVFSFHGAIVRDGTKLPYFSGSNIVPENCSSVMISDPALYENENLTLAWFAGLKKFDLQNILVEVFNKIKSQTLSNRLIFCGGSGGGFAALYYGSRFENSVIIASNPQTNILNYYKGHVSKFLENFPCKKEELGDFIDFNVCDIYKKNNESIVFYMQNTTDFFHVENHLKPFISAIGGQHGDAECSSEKIWFDNHQCGLGHKSRPASQWKDIVRFFCNFNGDLSSIFASNDFLTFIKESEILWDSGREQVIYSNRNGALESFVEVVDKINNEEKPDPLLFKKYFTLARKNSIPLSDVDSCFNKSLKIYPRGWVLKMTYAQSLYEYGETQRALKLLCEISEKMGDKTPISVMRIIQENDL